MLTTIPLPLPDQTLLSLVALAWMWNPLGTWTQAGNMFLGERVYAGTLAHSGVRRCFKAMESLGYEKPEDLLEGHCHLPLVRPFVDPIEYAHSVKVMLDDQPRRLIRLSRHNMINEQFMYCGVCIDIDQRKRGYAYARRAHQVIGVTVCHEHGQLLQTLVPECSDKYATRGILVAACSGYPAAWRLESPTALGTAEWAHRYAKFVAATLAGELDVIDAQTRRRSYVQRLQARHPLEGSLGAALSRDLETSVGGPALRTIDLDPRARWSANWPWLVLDGATYATHPLINLVTIATLFDSVADYHRACDEIDQTETLGGRSTTAHVAVPRQIALSKAMIRDLLREDSLKRIAEKHGLSYTTMKTRLCSYPALAQRRPAALKRRLRRHARLELRRFLSQQPNADRKQFKKANVAAYDRLMRFDREWFDTAMPSGRERSMANKSLDTALASDTTALTMQLLTSRYEHLRRTWKHLLSILDPALGERVRKGHLPATVAVVQSFVETQAQHLDRCTAHLQALLNRGDRATAKRWSLRVAKAYPRYAELLKEQLNGQAWSPPVPRPVKPPVAQRRIAGASTLPA